MILIIKYTLNVYNDKKYICGYKGFVSLVPVENYYKLSQVDSFSPS